MAKEDMVILMHNLMKMVDKQNAREHKRANREEKRDRDRSRSARKKSKKDDLDDEPCFDIVGALARFDLQIDVSRLPATKEIMTFVRQAKKAVRVGICPMVSGKLDKRFLPSCQATAEWAKALDPEKPRLMTWQTLWCGGTGSTRSSGTGVKGPSGTVRTRRLWLRVNHWQRPSEGARG